MPNQGILKTPWVRTTKGPRGNVMLFYSRVQPGRGTTKPEFDTWFFPASGGEPSNYNAAVTEAIAATSTQASVLVLPAAVTEALSGSAAQTAALTLPVVVTEAAGASEAQGAALSVPVAVTEALSGSAVQGVVLSTPVAVTEALSGSAVQGAGLALSVDAAEALSASAVQGATLTVAVGVTEPVIMLDNSLSEMFMFESFMESVAATDLAETTTSPLPQEARMAVFNPTTAFVAYGPLTAAERWSVRDGEAFVTMDALTGGDQGQLIRPGDTVDFPAGVTVYARTPKYAAISREINMAAMNASIAPGVIWGYAAASGGIQNTSPVTIKTAAGVNLRNYIRSFQISAEVLGIATEIAIRDGSGGTVLWRGKIGMAGLTGLNVPLIIPLKSSTDTLLEVCLLTSVGSGAVYFNAQGYAAL